MSNLNNPTLIFYVAKEYLENGTLYASKYFKKNNFTTNDLSSFLNFAKLCVPATNISFSLELAFKGFLFNSLKGTEHDLFKLYNLLDADIKKRIYENYINHNTYKEFIKVSLNDGKEHGKIQEVKIHKDERFVSKMLKLHKHSFIKFRYVYELNKNQAYSFDFKELSNLALSALIVLGQTLNIKLETHKKIKV